MSTVPRALHRLVGVAGWWEELAEPAGHWLHGELGDTAAAHASDLTFLTDPAPVAAPVEATAERALPADPFTPMPGAAVLVAFAPEEEDA